MVALVSGVCLFEELVDKQIFLIKKGDFVRTGKLLEVDYDFIKLEHHDGRVEYIAISEISSMREQKEEPKSD